MLHSSPLRLAFSIIVEGTAGLGWAGGIATRLCKWRQLAVGWSLALEERLHEERRQHKYEWMNGYYTIWRGLRTKTYKDRHKDEDKAYMCA